MEPFLQWHLSNWCQGDIVDMHTSYIYCSKKHQIIGCLDILYSWSRIPGWPTVSAEILKCGISGHFSIPRGHKSWGAVRFEKLKNRKKTENCELGGSFQVHMLQIPRTELNSFFKLLVCQRTWGPKDVILHVVCPWMCSNYTTA